MYKRQGLAFPYYFQKDRKTVCSRLKGSAVKSDAKIARVLGRDGLQIARILFFVGTSLLSERLAKLTDAKVDRRTL